jgi:hypothetical protein
VGVRLRRRREVEVDREGWWKKRVKCRERREKRRKTGWVVWFEMLGLGMGMGLGGC